MKKIKIFLDDERFPGWIYRGAKNRDWKIVRSVEEFKSLINSLTPQDIEFISFDNDLGADSSGNPLPEGKDAIKWLVDDKQFDITNIETHVHSANWQAADFSQGLLNNWRRFLNAQTDEDIIREMVRKELERKDLS